MIKLAIFDLDGTVCDTIEDLAEATNYALGSLGHPTHETEKYKYFVGNGIPKLIYRALPEKNRTEPEISEAKKLMLDYYAVHFADNSAPYSGIMEMLSTLKEKGIHIAICTNKAHNMAVTIAEKIFGGIFEDVIGQQEGRPLKPDSFSPMEIINKFGVKPEETVFIGDSGVDMQTAVNTGTDSIGVTWGFRTVDELKENGAGHIAETPSDILSIINNL